MREPFFRHSENMDEVNCFRQRLCSAIKHIWPPVHCVRRIPRDHISDLSKSSFMKGWFVLIDGKKEHDGRWKMSLVASSWAIDT